MTARADLQTIFVPTKDNRLKMSDEKSENTKKSEMLMVQALVLLLMKQGLLQLPYNR